MLCYYVEVEDGMPATVVKYHQECRLTFTHKNDLAKYKVQDSDGSSKRRSLRGNDLTVNNILPNICIFCNKNKYVPKTRTREALLSCSEFRAHDKIKQCALQHVNTCSELMPSAEKVLTLCSKDLISSEAKYHKSCYKHFVQINYISKAEGQGSGCSQEGDIPYDILKVNYRFSAKS